MNENQNKQEAKPEEINLAVMQAIYDTLQQLYPNLLQANLDKYLKVEHK